MNSPRGGEGKGERNEDLGDEIKRKQVQQTRSEACSKRCRDHGFHAPIERKKTAVNAPSPCRGGQTRRPRKVRRTPDDQFWRKTSPRQPNTTAPPSTHHQKKGGEPPPNQKKGTAHLSAHSHGKSSKKSHTLDQRRKAIRPAY